MALECLRLAFFLHFNDLWRILNAQFNFKSPETGANASPDSSLAVTPALLLTGPCDGAVIKVQYVPTAGHGFSRLDIVAEADHRIGTYKLINVSLTLLVALYRPKAEPITNGATICPRL